MMYVSSWFFPWWTDFVDILTSTCSRPFVRTGLPGRRIVKPCSSNYEWLLTSQECSSRDSVHPVSPAFRPIRYRFVLCLCLTKNAVPCTPYRISREQLGSSKRCIAIAPLRSGKITTVDTQNRRRSCDGDYRFVGFACSTRPGIILLQTTCRFSLPLSFALSFNRWSYDKQ